MKALIDGKAYDTSISEEISNYPRAHGEEFLRQTEGGEFFLHVSDAYLDGKLMGEKDPLDHEIYQVSAAERKKRLRLKDRIVPLTNREALIWCVKTQIPEQFVGYLLDCIDTEPTAKPERSGNP